MKISSVVRQQQANNNYWLTFFFHFINIHQSPEKGKLWKLFLSKKFFFQFSILQRWIVKGKFKCNFKLQDFLVARKMGKSLDLSHWIKIFFYRVSGFCIAMLKFSRSLDLLLPHFRVVWRLQIFLTLCLVYSFNIVGKVVLEGRNWRANKMKCESTWWVEECRNISEIANFDLKRENIFV